MIWTKDDARFVKNDRLIFKVANAVVVVVQCLVGVEYLVILALWRIFALKTDAHILVLSLSARHASRVERVRRHSLRRCLLSLSAVPRRRDTR